MKRVIAFLCSVGMLGVGATTALSQGVVIDSNDVKAVFAVGNTITYHHDKATHSVDIGSTGGPGTYNLSGLGTSSTEVLKSVTIGSTPYGSSYPQATHAFLNTAFSMRHYIDATYGWVTLTSTEAYYYYKVGNNTDYLGLKGNGIAYLDMLPGFPINFSAQWNAVPPSTEMDLPLEYLKSWDGDFLDTLHANATVPILGPLDIGIGDAFDIKYTVDGFGSLTLPVGEPQDALRIREETRKEGGPLRVWYLFVTKTGATARVLLRDSLAVSGTVGVDSIRWSGGVIDVPVPIQLAGFTATRLNETSASLEWSTLSETNNFGFFIQRKRSGENDFADLPGSFIAGHGTTVSPQTYSYRDESVDAGTWWYRLKQVDLDGTINFSDPVGISVLSTVAKEVPTTTELAPNYPNPFNPTTSIRYSVGVVSREGVVATKVRLAVHDLLGREVAVLVDGQKEPGTYEVTFDATGLPSGMYLYRLTAGDFSATRRMVLAR